MPRHTGVGSESFDATPGIVSVWAELDGRAWVFRRCASSGELLVERERFAPWLLLASLRDLAHVRSRLVSEQHGPAAAHSHGTLRYRELDGPGALRFLVRADDGHMLRDAILRGASQRLGRPVTRLRELGPDELLVLPPEEQYLVMSGRVYFRGLSFDQLRRVQFDLETTGLDPDRNRIFLIAVGTREGPVLLELEADDDRCEAQLIQRFAALLCELDPDVVENHNLHGFDLPFLVHRATRLGVRMRLGRNGDPGLGRRPAARGASLGAAAFAALRRLRYTVFGRELIDTQDAVLRYDFAARDLPGHGLKAVARHFGISGESREVIPGAQIYQVYQRDPERVRRYARADVAEAAALARLLGGAAFALAAMAPRRYERLADAGSATGVLDPLLVRAYLHAGAALPVPAAGDGTAHSGAALYLHATGVAERIVKADVASLYPSLMRQYAIGPKRDHLGVLLSIVDTLVEQRLSAKANAQAAPAGSSERHTSEAFSAAMKLVVNSAYGYLGAIGLTRFADVDAANTVTRHGRELLTRLCRELALRGMTLLQADTDGVYFAVPAHFTEADERRVVSEVGALLPPRVKLEFEGRYAAMLSHETKNYALLPYGSKPLILRGVAFRSRRSEPFGEAFLRKAITCLLERDIPGVQAIYLETARAIRERTLSTRDVSSEIRLTKTPEQYRATRRLRRDSAYEALLEHRPGGWTLGERVRIYRKRGGRMGLLTESERELPASVEDPRDYDTAFYLAHLRDTFAARLVHAFEPADFAAVFADPEQTSLFAPALDQIKTILRRQPAADAAAYGPL